jgi:hypothetical protein
MTKLRNYDKWEEDDFDPYAYSVNEMYQRGKKRKNADRKKERYEEEEDFYEG